MDSRTVVASRRWKILQKCRSCSEFSLLSSNFYLQTHVPPSPKTWWKVQADSIACRRSGHGRIVRIDKDHQARSQVMLAKKPTDQSVSAAHLSTHPSFCEALSCPTIPLAACPRFTWTLFMGRRFFRMPRACARLQTNALNVWVEWWIRWDLVVENGVWHSQNKNRDGF